MDILERFLPESRGSEYKDIDISIPYLANYPVDDGTFQSYPMRRGFPMSKAHDGLQLQLGPSRTYREYSDLLQSWLLFDLIHVIARLTHVKFDLLSLVDRKNPTRHCITLKRPLESFEQQIRVPGLYRTFTYENLFRSSCWSNRQKRNRLSLSHATPDHVRGRALENIISIAELHLTLFDFEDENDVVSTDDRARIILSIKYFLFEIREILWSQYHYIESAGKQRLLWMDCRDTKPPSAIVMKRFLQLRGWCPILADDLLSQSSLRHVYLAAVIVRKSARSSSHGDCTSSRGCLAYNVTLESQRQIHVSLSCRCSNVQPDMGKVYEILEAGQIPIVGLEPDGNNIRLIVKPADSQTSHIAISHVWSDGYANAQVNGLLSCQLQRLYHRILYIVLKYPENLFFWGFSGCGFLSLSTLLNRSSKKQVYIWMDALCVPVIDNNNRARSVALKQRAITLMTPTYAGASSVLVLHRELEQIKREQKSQVSNCAEVMSYRLRYSTWMTRCWTLQEGALARRLFFQCDGWACENLVSTDLAYKIHEEPTEAPSKEVVASIFQQNVRKLLTRSTSLKADIHQILANLGTLDADEISKLELRDRSKAFMYSQGEAVPMEMLLRPLRAIPQKPCEEWWIPDLDGRDSFYKPEGIDLPPAALCSNGVLVELTRHFCAYVVKAPMPQKFWIRAENRAVWIDLDLNPQVCDFSMKSTQDSGSPSSFTLLLVTGSQCLNAEGFLGRGICLTTSSEVVASSESESQGAIISVYNGAFSMGLETPVSVIRRGSAPTIEASMYQPSFSRLAPPESGRKASESLFYLIQCRTSGWPRLASVRNANGAWFGIHYSDSSHVIWLTVCIFPFSAGLIVSSLALPHANIPKSYVTPIESSIWILGFLLIALLVYLWFWRAKVKRKRHYKDWVQTFVNSNTDYGEPARS